MSTPRECLKAWAEEYDNPEVLELWDRYCAALEQIRDNPDAVASNISGGEIQPWQDKRGRWRGSARLIARAAVGGDPE